MEGCSAHTNGNPATFSYRFATGVGIANVDGTALLVASALGFIFKGAAYQIPFSGTASLTDATVPGAGVPTAAQMRGGWLYQDASGGNVAMTTRTAAQLVADIPGVAVGTTIYIDVSSNHASNTSTIAGGTGVTLTGSGAVTQTGGRFRLVFTNVTAAAEAVALARVG